jgi:hypothetical protein
MKRTHRKLHDLPPGVTIERGMPVGCKCAPAEWDLDESAPPVCSAYAKDKFFPGYCKACEHPKKCHLHETRSPR